jgi:hypothetical protein
MVYETHLELGIKKDIDNENGQNKTSQVVGTLLYC